MITMRNKNGLRLGRPGKQSKVKLVMYVAFRYMRSQGRQSKTGRHDWLTIDWKHHSLGREYSNKTQVNPELRLTPECVDLRKDGIVVCLQHIAS